MNLDHPRIQTFLDRVRQDHGERMHTECATLIAAYPDPSASNPLAVIVQARARLQADVIRDCLALNAQQFDSRPDEPRRARESHE